MLRRFALVPLLLLAACQVPPGPSTGPRLDSILQQGRYAQANWGLLVSDLQTGEVLLARDADKLFGPASTTKLFSVAAALEAFGAEHRFQTRLLRFGELDAEGRLDGVLVLSPEGDLNLGGRDDGQDGLEFARSDHIYARNNPRTGLTRADPRRGLQILARRAKAAGLREVEEVVVDDRLFEATASTGSGPRLVTPIMVNDNLVDFRISPTQAGAKARVRSRPGYAGMAIDNRVQTTAGGKFGVQISRRGAHGFVLTGNIPAGHPEQIEVCEVADPARFARSLLIEALQAEGIRVATDHLGPNPDKLLPERAAELDEVCSLDSAPLSQEARLILKVSHNLHASTLPMLLAVQAGERSLRAGMQRQGVLLRQLIGPLVDSISFGGAAGGDRADKASPRATVALLRAVAARPYGPSFRRGLPILGVDGTLHNIAKAGPAVGKVQAKTGTYYVYNAMLDRPLLTAKALGGYMTARSGRELAFCVVVNNVHLRGGMSPDVIGEDLGQIATRVQQHF